MHFFLHFYITPISQPPAASRMAGVRFGNTQDVVVLWSDDEDEISEYVRGLMLIGCTTLFLFMVRKLCRL
jgi:hypothetical protein